ncbi:hypothetical protein, partial [Streptomyces roseolus]|uniref:hypothetical protein n=1 Tax=Streptomyces roseolus TaxID=67358 RepID=UPI003657E5F4
MVTLPVVGQTDWGPVLNDALTSLQDQVTETGDARAVSTKGVYVPPNWGEVWRPRRDAAASSPARIVIAGDSLSQGYFASNLHTTSWVGLMRQSLQNSYGDG